MTVTYSKDVATNSYCFLWNLMIRWRGSIYKFVWRDFAVFAILYFVINLSYQLILNDSWKKWFDHLAEYCQTYNNLIPVAFILGFYVSIVVSRFWEQLNALPWPQRTAFFVASMIHDLDEEGRILYTIHGRESRDEEGRKLRRTIVRYLTVAYILAMKAICPPVKTRFPTFQYMTKEGLITKDEEAVLTELSLTNRTDRIGLYMFNNEDEETREKLKKLRKKFNDLQEDIKYGRHDASEATPNVYYVPLLWAVNLVNQAMEQKRITDHSTQRILIEEINNYRGQCGTLLNFDWITVPLVYTQVVTISVYTFFLSCLLGRQTLDDHQGDLYFPIFTFLQFIFYMGWFEVAMCLLNPFGGDDDDFEINPLIEDNLQIAFTMVDELCDFAPNGGVLDKDKYFNLVDVDIAYNESSEVYRYGHHHGSADDAESATWNCCSCSRKQPKKEHEAPIYKKKPNATHGSSGGPTGDKSRRGVRKSDTEETSLLGEQPEQKHEDKRKAPTARAEDM